MHHNVWMLLYVAVLFFVLTPGVLLSIPNGGSKTTVAAVHAVVFALVFHFTHKLVWNATKSVRFGHLESFEPLNKFKSFPQSDSPFNTPAFSVSDSYTFGGVNK
jgi:hypothetical protein